MTRASRQAGLTLVEVLVYAALLAITTTVLIRFALQINQRTAVARTTSTVLSNAHGALTLLTREIQHANGVYDPTSVFDIHPGQLSLATYQNLPADEKETYVDFYIDDDRLYRKRESQPAELVTSENIRITNLTFTYLNQGSRTPAVQINLTAAPANTASPSASQSTITVTTSASFRAYE